MNIDESIFDYLAAAEETANQLDGMTKRIPEEVKAILLEEWRKSPWLAELPKAMDAARAATERTESATRFLNRSLKIACLAVCLAAVVIPLATWGLAYWQALELRDRIVSLRSEITTLVLRTEALKSETGAGIQLVAYKDGTRGVIIPEEYIFSHIGQNAEGREVVIYTPVAD